jgi:hypothetical protein
MTCQSTIIGQLALTALGGKYSLGCSWLVAAMALNTFSVIAACFRQMPIGMLNQATEIRIWLSDQYTYMEIPRELHENGQRSTEIYRFEAP